MNEPSDRDGAKLSSWHRPGQADDVPATGDTGRAAEFTAFYRETVKPLVSFLILQGATLAEAADIAQDTMAKAFQRRHTIGSPRAWAYRVAGRELIRTRVDRPEPPVEPLPQPPLLRDGDIEGWELRHDLVRAMSLLPPRQRQVMAWALTGYQPGEIAEELGLPVGRVRQNLHLARRRLAALLSAKEART